MGANQKNRKRVKAPIYGSQRGTLLESRLINSYDEVEFHLKLVSLGSCSQNQQLIFEKI